MSKRWWMGATAGVGERAKTRAGRSGRAGAPTGVSRWTALLRLTLGTLLSLPLLAGCTPQFEILSPATGITLPENGELALSIDFGDPLPAGTQVAIWILGFTTATARFAPPG